MFLVLGVRKDESSYPVKYADSCPTRRVSITMVVKTTPAILQFRYVFDNNFLFNTCVKVGHLVFLFQPGEEG